MIGGESSLYVHAFWGLIARGRVSRASGMYVNMAPCGARLGAQQHCSRTRHTSQLTIMHLTDHSVAVQESPLPLDWQTPRDKGDFFRHNFFYGNFH